MAKNFKESSLLKSSDLHISDVRQIHCKFMFLAHKPAIDKSWNCAISIYTPLNRNIHIYVYIYTKYLYLLWSSETKKLQGKKVAQPTLIPDHQVPFFVGYSTHWIKDSNNFEKVICICTKIPFKVLKWDVWNAFDKEFKQFTVKT